MLKLRPPQALERPTTPENHNRQRVDPYAWLRERDDPATLDYLRAENEYTDAVMADTETLRQELYAEMVERIRETDVTAPVRNGAFLYYTRTEKGRSYPIYCRKQGNLEAAEGVLLDCNELAAGHPFLALGVFELSPDQEILAYSTDTQGDERFRTFLKDLGSGELVCGPIPDTGATLAWASDHRSFFYLGLDDSNRPYQVYRGRVGKPASTAELIYEEDDEAFHLDVRRTRSGRFVLVTATSMNTTEVRYLDAGVPESPPRVLAPRRVGIEYGVEHQGESFWIVTNEGATNFKLMEAPLDDLAPESWNERIPHREDVKLEAVHGFSKHLVIVQREEGLQTISVLDTASGEQRGVALPDSTYEVEIGECPEYNGHSLRLEYSSLLTPPSSFDYDLVDRNLDLRKQIEIRGYDRDLFTCERLSARAADGTEIPISLVCSKNARREGPAPLYLTGYGAYGLSYEPGFSNARLSLLERGVIFAIAHVRGGGEFGRPWYEAGRLRKKKYTFSDFIACAEHLVLAGYTQPERLAIHGASAGGLLVGAVMNQRPDLFRVAVADAPFVDLINTMLDSSLPLTVIEYEEWGNPDDNRFFEYMMSYAPYENVGAHEYPHLLVLAGLNDKRVSYWEPAKWIARLRALKRGGHEILLKTNLGVGHSGESDRYEAFREVAFEYGFVLKYLGMTRAGG